MAKNDSQDSSVELWGREFKIAKNGLDEAQIVSFVNELISQRDTLTQHEQHLASLTRLAEKTVSEADKLAEDIKGEALDQVKAEASAIIAKAEEQARQLLEEERTKAVTAANEEAEAIKVNAEREADSLIEQERRRIQPELREMAQRVYGELLSQLESLQQQVVAFETGFEHKLPQPVEQTGPTAKEAESQPVIQTKEPANTSEPEAKAPLYNQDTTTYEGEVALEILPPLDIKQIMGILRYLDSLAEIENTELIPLTDRPVITAWLRQPMPLLDVLLTLPEVEQAKAVKDGEITTITETVPTDGQRRWIRITLSGNSALDETKERLGSEVSKTLSG